MHALVVPREVSNVFVHQRRVNTTLCQYLTIDNLYPKMKVNSKMKLTHFYNEVNLKSTLQVQKRKDQQIEGVLLCLEDYTGLDLCV